MQDTAWNFMTHTFSTDQSRQRVIVQDSVPTSPLSEPKPLAAPTRETTIEPDAEPGIGPIAEEVAPLPQPGGGVGGGGWAVPQPREPKPRPNVHWWVPLALVTFGVCAEMAARTQPFGLLGAYVCAFGLVVARLAAKTPPSAGFGVDGSVDDSVDENASWSHTSTMRTTGRTTGRTTMRTRNAATVIGIGAVIGLLWRSSSTLRTLNVFAILGAVVLASDATLAVSTLLVRRLFHAVVLPIGGFYDAVAHSFRWLRGKVRFVGRWRSTKGSANNRAIGAGLAIALPLVVVFGVLLASADAVFASLFSMPDINLWIVWPTTAVVMRIALYALLLAAPVLSGASPFLNESSQRVGGTGRPIEAFVVLCSINVLFGVFCFAQLVGMSGAAKHVLETNGLTYAQYARSGFFQLVVVAVLTLAVIGAARAAAGSLADSRLRWASAVTALLTLGITAVAINRLSLYMRAYGLTVDRIVSQAGAITIGLIFVLVTIGIVASRPGRDLRGWTTAGSLGVAALMIFGLHVLNPEAWSVRDGFARGGVRAVAAGGFVRDDQSGQGGRLGGSTYVEFSDDSVPEIVRVARRNPALAVPACDQNVARRRWYQWTWSSARAERSRAALCSR